MCENPPHIGTVLKPNEYAASSFGFSAGEHVAIKRSDGTVRCTRIIMENPDGGWDVLVEMKPFLFKTIPTNTRHVYKLVAHEAHDDHAPQTRD